MSHSQAPEEVLLEPPEEIYIEVSTATSSMPKTNGRFIYTHRRECRPWSVDKAGSVKLLRWGFLLVPDLGGTAHAYCGTTLKSCMGDLLEWWKKPSHSDMLRA